MKMLLDDLVLGEPVRADLVAASSPHRFERMLHMSSQEDLLGAKAYWMFTLFDDWLLWIDLCVSDGDFVALASIYDSIAVKLRARHGEPTSAPPDDDAARNVTLEAKELPNDRDARLRSMEWAGDSDQIQLWLHLTWYGLVLQMRARRESVAQTAREDGGDIVPGVSAALRAVIEED